MNKRKQSLANVHCCQLLTFLTSAYLFSLTASNLITSPPLRLCWTGHHNDISSTEYPPNKTTFSVILDIGRSNIFYDKEEKVDKNRVATFWGWLMLRYSISKQTGNRHLVTDANEGHNKGLTIRTPSKRQM